MFHKILCATDGSDSAMQAVRSAQDLAQKYSAHLTILNVAPLRVLDLMHSRGSMGPEDLFPKEVEARLAKHAHDVLASAKAAALEAGAASVETKDILGHPGDAICQEAIDGAYDLVVVGSHGQSSLRRAILGSTSDYVVRHSKCPVLVIRSA